MQARTEAILKNTGFTIVELMVAMVISLVVMGAIYSTFQVQQQSYIHQERVAAVQQNLRAAMYYITREIRMAGYDPTGSSNFGVVTAASDSINFTMDYLYGDSALSDNGVIDSGEDITYSLSGTDLVRNAGSGNQVIAENIDSLELTYLDQDSNGTNETVHIKIVGKSQKDTTISRTLESNAKCRNIDM
ncbi:MAG: prepilin-type N-terminal cleavage/methylation domain-containing protein [Desulfobacteraceae bacterium]|nr:prepilin-type N-terminal cleavage/methylation domain-containing protein [Desulfobacteraceae bacterium]